VPRTLATAVAAAVPGKAEEPPGNPECAIRAPAETFPSIRDPGAGAVGDVGAIPFTVSTRAARRAVADPGRRAVGE